MLHLSWAGVQLYRLQNPWKIVPQHASAVLAVHDWPELHQQLQASEAVSQLQQVPETAFFSGLLQQADSLYNSHNWLASTLADHPLLVSYHAGQGFLFYLPLHSFAGSDAWYDRIADSLAQQQGHELLQTYRGYQVRRWRLTNQELGWFRHKNYLVAGSNSLLLEDAIRQLDQPRGQFFNEARKRLLNDKEPAGAVLVIKTAGVGEWLRQVAGLPRLHNLPGLLPLADVFSLEFRATARQLAFSGKFCKAERNWWDFYDWFGPQADSLSLPGPDNGLALRLTVAGSSFARLAEASDLAQEIFENPRAFTRLKTSQGDEYLLFATEDRKNTTEALLKVGIAQQQGNFSVGEKEYPIYTLTEPVLGPLPFTGLSGRKLFATFAGDTLVVAGSSAALQQYPALPVAATWPVEGLQLQIIDPLRQLAADESWMQGALKDFLLKNFRYLPLPERLLLSTGDMAAHEIDFAGELQFAKTEGADLLLAGKEAGFELPLQRDVFSGPLLVTSHVDQQAEILFQDEGYRLHLCSRQGERLWQSPVWQPMVPEVHQVDVYNNGKLQYLFAAGSKIAMVDRLGRSVRGFPIMLPPYFSAAAFTAFKTVGSGYFHMLVVGEEGHAWLFNRWGTAARGWQPRRLGAPPAGPPLHLRKGKEDMLAFLLQDGTLNLLNLNARSVAGFPLLFNLPVSNRLLLEGGPGFDYEHRLVMLTDGGELVKVNLQGKLLVREQIGVRLPSASYSLCADRWRPDAWLVARQDNRQISFYDQQARLMFEHYYPSRNQKTVQFFDFGPLRSIIAVTDAATGQCYLHLPNGQLLDQGPLEFSGEVIVRYSSTAHAYIITGPFGKTLKEVYLQGI